MWFIGAAKMSTNTFSQLLCREQSIGFDNMLLRMHPFRLNGIEPGTFGRQQEGQNAYAFPRALDQLVMLPDPGAHHQAFMPRGIVPDQQPVALALSLQALAAPVQEQNAHRADGTPRDETHPVFGALPVRAQAAQRATYALVGDEPWRQTLLEADLGGKQKCPQAGRLAKVAGAAVEQVLQSL